MKKMMMALCALVSISCADTMSGKEDTHDEIMPAEANEYGEYISPLSTPCAPGTWMDDCAKELAMAAGDSCVKWPGGVWCHPVDKICVLTVDAECYFDKQPATCTDDADCDDGNSCTFEACLGSGAASWCYSTDFPDGSPCGYSKALGALMVCESHPQLAAPACVPNLDDEPECTSHAECDDGLPCTYDLCNDLTELCSHAAIPECCTMSGHCASDQPYCVETLYSPVPGVKWCQPCLQATNAGCPQGETCFWGIEAAPSPPLPEQGKSVYWCAQCASNIDCNDGDPCTIDECLSDDTCAYAPNPACDEPEPECATAEDCVGLKQYSCENNVLHITGYACDNGTCVVAGGGVKDCVNGCADKHSCNPECVDDTDCPDASQFDTVACDDGTCIYGNPEPVVKIVWDMPEGWWVDYVRLEGTYCEDGAQPANQQADKAIKQGTCKMSAGWGPFLTIGMKQLTTEWSTKKGTIENAKQDPKVVAYVAVQPGARWLIVNWVWSFNNQPVQWLCNDKLGPKDYGNTWDGKATWGDHAFYAPDGTKLPVKVEPGNQLEGCLFWIDVGQVADLY